MQEHRPTPDHHNERAIEIADLTVHNQSMKPVMPTAPMGTAWVEGWNCTYAENIRSEDLAECQSQQASWPSLSQVWCLNRCGTAGEGLFSHDKPRRNGGP